MRIRLCTYCGDKIPDYHHSNQCQACYNYSKVHPEGTYNLPPVGQVHYAPNGDVICHICGQAHRRLGSHIHHKHHLTQNEYRDMFQLYHSTKLSNKEYIKKMKEYNDDNKEQVVYKNLLNQGSKTRFYDNCTSNARKFGHTIKETTV